MKVDQKYLETEFSIAICRPTCDKWQSKTLFLAAIENVTTSDECRSKIYLETEFSIAICRPTGDK